MTKEVIIKLYDKSNSYIRNLDEALLDYNIEKTLFSGSGAITITLKNKIDELEPDIKFNNKIKIYSRNKWSATPRLIYYGYITSIDPTVTQGEQQTNITCLGVISKLSNDFIRTGTDLAYEVGMEDIDDHIKILLDHYRDSINTLYGSYNSSMIVATTYFPSGASPDINVAEDTSGIGTIPYRYFNSKHLDGIKEIGKFLPKNDDGNAYWYWYIGDDGKFYLKKLSTNPDHILYINKHLVSLNIRKNIEGVMNKVFFWNENGDYAGEMIRTVYDDSNSQSNFDIIADKVNDSNVSTYLQARLLAEGKKDEAKDVSIESTATVSEANYDILSFKLGDVVDIQDTKDPCFLRKLILSGTADSGTTTTMVDVSRTEAIDYWNNYYIKFTSGTNAGEVREITDFVATSDTIYFRALDIAISTGDQYEIYAKKTRLVIQRMTLTPREIVLDLSSPKPDLTTQVETDREYVDKQLTWFGNVLVKLDGTRIPSGVQHWITEDVNFVSGNNPLGIGINTDTQISWSAGSFVLPSDVKRVISSGTSSIMVAGKQYYFFIDESTCYYTDVATISGSGSIKEGETFLIDSTKNWITDQYKGYVVSIGVGAGWEERHIIAHNTATILYVEAHDPIDFTHASINYEIHKLALRETNNRATGSLLKSGSATDTDGTTTSLDDSTLGVLNDFWNGYEIKFLSGKNIGLRRIIKSYINGSTRLTWKQPLPNAVLNGDTYQLYLSSDNRIIITKGEIATLTPVASIISQLATTVPESQVMGAINASFALNSSADLITDIINARLNTDTKTILAGFSFSPTDYSGAFKTGDITWNTSTGSITGGSGGIFYKNGLVFAASGVPTITLNGITGNATFAGDVTGATITGGTITGTTFQTAADGYRVKIAGSGEEIEFLYDDTSWGTLDFWVDAFSGYGLQIYAGATAAGINIFAEAGPAANNYGVNLYCAGASFGISSSPALGQVVITSVDLIPDTAASLNLGSDANYFDSIYYKTLVDKGCLGSFDDGVEMLDGTIVSDVEALKSIKITNKKTVYGVPMFDYKTMPKAVYKKAMHKRKEMERDKNDNPYIEDENGKKIIYEDGAETTALISIIIGAIKELDKRISLL